jgi:hypothetical protein
LLQERWEIDDQNQSILDEKREEEDGSEERPRLSLSVILLVLFFAVYWLMDQTINSTRAEIGIPKPDCPS